MARPRAELSERLHAICNNVYFQPPTGTKIVYPCIVYDLEKTNVRYADNGPYVFHDEYSIKYITRDSDDPSRISFLFLPLCTSEKMYVNDNLYHYPYTIYW